MWTESELRDKLRKIEVLYAGAACEGEREAAQSARSRIQERLAALGRVEPEIEMKFTLGDGWNVRLFLALCRRYGVQTFRYKGQRRTTVMVKAPATFLEQTLWPEFQDLAKTLHTWLDETTDRLITEEIG